MSRIHVSKKYAIGSTSTVLLGGATLQLWAGVAIADKHPGVPWLLALLFATALISSALQISVYFWLYRNRVSNALAVAFIHCLVLYLSMLVCPCVMDHFAETMDPARAAPGYGGFGGLIARILETTLFGIFLLTPIFAVVVLTGLIFAVHSEHAWPTWDIKDGSGDQT